MGGFIVGVNEPIAILGIVIGGGLTQTAALREARWGDDASRPAPVGRDSYPAAAFWPVLPLVIASQLVADVRVPDPHARIGRDHLAGDPRPVRSIAISLTTLWLVPGLFFQAIASGLGDIAEPSA